MRLIFEILFSTPFTFDTFQHLLHSTQAITKKENIERKVLILQTQNQM